MTTVFPECKLFSRDPLRSFMSICINICKLHFKGSCPHAIQSVNCVAQFMHNKYTCLLVFIQYICLCLSMSCADPLLSPLS